jgi:RNA polymerase sigma-70 factor (ECF subfamily)
VPPIDKERAFARVFGPKSHLKTAAQVSDWLERLGIPAHDCEDVTQDVLVEVLKSWSTYNPQRSSPERWINRITVHIACHYRDRAVHRREVPSPRIPPNLRDLRAHEVVEILDCIDTLHPDARALFVDYNLRGVSMKDIAERHGISVSRAYKQHARARASFLAALGAGSTRASPAARADWERTPTLKMAVGSRERSVLTLRSIEGKANGLADIPELR